MEVTFFLAKGFSIYLVVIGIAMLFNREYYTTAANEMLDHSGLSFFTSIFTLILGIILVLSHNIWTLNWTVVITVLAWLTFLKGILRLLMPAHFSKCMRIYETSCYYYTVTVLSILVGLYLGCYGFML